jgi:Mg2+/Co2+ transporter CorB
MGWTLPTTGPRTLNGLIIEQMETIPAPGQRLRLGDYAIEVLQVTDNAVKTVRLSQAATAKLDQPG